MESTVEARRWVGNLSWRQEWQREALCVKLDVDPNIFFPTRHTSSRDIPRAKAICQRCPVQQECLDYALAVPREHDYGIFGGTTQDERRKMRNNGR